MLWKYRKSLPFIISLALNTGLSIAGVEIKWLKEIEKDGTEKEVKIDL